jgi:galactokinase
LGCSQTELLELLPAALQAAAATRPLLHLQQRALHVFSESQRVLQFKQICADDSLSGDAKLVRLGLLMDASHASCGGLYCCSCAELDTLVGLAKGGGALGARLTGEEVTWMLAGAVAASVGCPGRPGERVMAMLAGVVHWQQV